MEKQSNPHHLVLGKLKCFLTSAVISDTLDERYLQKIAKQLVLNGGFKKTDILNSVDLEILAGERKASIKVDFLIRFQKKIVALIKYSPGSLVTRRLSTIGLSRIIKPYQIPIAVITNGEDAEILDGNSGKVIGVDMTEEMIEKSREIAKKYEYDNVDFRLGDIDNLPVDDNSVDIVISNCVINLSPNKLKVYKEE